MADIQYQLMLNMLEAHPGQSILDVGCGTGYGLLFCQQKGMQVTGIDPSPYMLDIAGKVLGNRADLHRGTAEALPFDDNSFNYALLITCLEFVHDPRKALEETFRVAKDKVFIGIINRYAANRNKIRFKGLFTETAFNNAHFYSIWDIKKIILDLLGDIPFQWQNISLYPPASGKLGKKVANSQLAQKFPFGTYIGITATLMPRFRTRPLELKICPEHNKGAVPGLSSGQSGP
ncbi:MAG: class I SAM-dependent methyltransferase [Desulfobacterales bacterium]